MNKDRKPLYETVAEKLIEQLRKGTSPFQQPWSDGNAFSLPHNPTTGKAYRGLNSLWLQMQGYQDPRWLTFKQAREKGWMVEKGAKGTLINFVKTHDKVPARDGQGNPILKDDGKPKMINGKRETALITSAYVFNAEKVKGIEPLSVGFQDRQRWENLERVDMLVKNTDAVVLHGGIRACYFTDYDRIHMPNRRLFADASGYYSTLLHEIGHWTGHKSRLNRPSLYASDIASYALEELKVEIASLMLGNDLQVGYDQSQHAAYVGHWIKQLEANPFELYRSSAEAQQIRDYVLQFALTRNVEATPTDGLKLHDQVSYRGVSYMVTEMLSGEKLRLVDLDTGMNIRLSTSDNLYASLVKAKLCDLREKSDPETGMGRDQGRLDTGESVNKNLKR